MINFFIINPIAKIPLYFGVPNISHQITFLIMFFHGNNFGQIFNFFGILSKITLVMLTVKSLYAVTQPVKNYLSRDMRQS